MKRFSDAGSIPAASTKLKCAAAKAAKIPVYRDIAVYRDFFCDLPEKRGYTFAILITKAPGADLSPLHAASVSFEHCRTDLIDASALLRKNSIMTLLLRCRVKHCPLPVGLAIIL